MCSVALLLGSTLANFFAGLSLLGIAWNFLFLSGTTQVGRSCTPKEGPKVQSLTDGIAAVCTGTATLLSGIIVRELGWNGACILNSGLAIGVMASIASLWGLHALQ